MKIVGLLFELQSQADLLAEARALYASDGWFRAGVDQTLADAQKRWLEEHDCVPIDAFDTALETCYVRWQLGSRPPANLRPAGVCQ